MELSCYPWLLLMKSQLKQADILFSKYIRNRDKRCRRCNSTEYLQCAHVISRSYHQVRHDKKNAVALCRACHVYFTHHPLEWYDWANEELGRGKYSDLKEKAQQYHNKIDYKGIIEFLRQAIPK